MSTENKIKYGLCKVHYAIATIGDDGTASYGSVKPFPGAISLSLDPQGDRYVLNADNVEYYVNNNNQGYEGDLETALITEAVAKEILGEIEDSNGVLYEDAEAAAVHFALLFQFEGDAKATRHALYNCTVQRPNSEGETKGDSIEAKTETLSITAKPIYVEAVDKNVVKARTMSNTDDDTYDDWFESVYVPGESES